jgi:predicted acetyltransferase
LALIDGQPVSAGALAITTSGHGLLAGSATARAFRGRGCYAALVAHRWQVASELGLGALIVQASEMSAPILGRLGFSAASKLSACAEQTPI